MHNRASALVWDRTWRVVLHELRSDCDIEVPVSAEAVKRGLIWPGVSRGFLADSRSPQARKAFANRHDSVTCTYTF